VVLVQSVLRIRQFYRDNSIENQLNTNQLLLHSTAFILYMVAVVLYVVSWDLTISFPNNIMLALIYVIVYSLQCIVGAIAEILLALIFWKLAVKEDPLQAYLNVIVEEFSEEDEVMARIWNQFRQKQYLATEYSTS